MSIHNTIHVINSFNLSSAGIIADLQHTMNGLGEGSIIKSLTSGKEWKVIKRVIFNHTTDIQKVFASESTIVFYLSFGNMESKQKPREEILERELQNIFQYQLHAIGEYSKPELNDLLTINT